MVKPIQVGETVMLMRVYDEQGKFMREVNDHDVPIVFRRAERIQISGQMYAINNVGRIELDPEREIVFRPVHLRSAN
jgi:hypothetical protein